MKFIINVSWTTAATITIEADNQEAAKDIIWDMPTDKFPSPEYVDESFAIDSIEEG